MKVKFESRFEKDLKLIKDTKLLKQLKSIIIECNYSDMDQSHLSSFYE